MAVKDSTERKTFSTPEFFNQYDSFSWPAVADRACGPTVIAMAINQMMDRGICHNNTRVTPKEIAFHAGHMTRLPMDIPQYYLKITSAKPDGSADYLPIGHRLDRNLAREIKADTTLSLELVNDITHPELSQAEGNYQPIYTLNGWDHRGSERFIREYGITARQFGDKHSDKFSLRLLVSLVENGNLIMASAHNIADSSHLILIHDYREEDDKFLISDPKELEPHWADARQWYNHSFRGYGTVVYNTQQE